MLTPNPADYFLGGRLGSNFIYFLVFIYCYSPDFLVFKMGSFVAQLATVAEI